MIFVHLVVFALLVLALYGNCPGMPVFHWTGGQLGRPDTDPKDSSEELRSRRHETVNMFTIITYVYLYVSVCIHICIFIIILLKV